MKTFIKNLARISAAFAITAITAIPLISNAESGYRLSPQITGFAFVETAVADTICRMLPAANAAVMPFCMWAGTTTPTTPISGSGSGVSNFLITNQGPNTSMITWTTSIPTSTMLWYSGNPLAPSTLRGYSVPAQGYTTSHSIIVTNPNPGTPYSFMVGGQDMNGSLVYSGQQSF